MPKIVHRNLQDQYAKLAADITRFNFRTKNSLVNDWKKGTLEHKAAQKVIDEIKKERGNE